MKKLVLSLKQNSYTVYYVWLMARNQESGGVVALSCVFGVDVTPYFFAMKKVTTTYFTYAHTCEHIMYYILTKEKITPL